MSQPGHMNELINEILVQIGLIKVCVEMLCLWARMGHGSEPSSLFLRLERDTYHCLVTHSF